MQSPAPADCLDQIENDENRTMDKTVNRAMVSAEQNTENVLQVIDIGNYLQAEDKQTKEMLNLCKAVAQMLRDSGCLVIRDPRVKSDDNETFLSLMEHYFEQSYEDKLPDVHPELSFQVGATPEGTERPRILMDTDMKTAVDNLPEDSKPVMPRGPDVKWRFLWRIGPRPPSTTFAELNAPPVVPKAFPQWSDVLDNWGNKMLAAVQTVAEMAARGFGLEASAITERMSYGPHLLAPTGVDLSKHCSVGSVYAGYHYDLNLMTIHGKSRFPGLFVWLRDGRRVSVKIPDGCLLVQVGKQLEWLTGGYVQAGMHEVVCTEATRSAVRKASAAGQSCWRVSSTVFAHVASDQLLKALGHFATESTCSAYPPLPAGQYVQQELQTIKLKQ